MLYFNCFSYEADEKLSTNLLRIPDDCEHPFRRIVYADSELS